MTKLDSPEYLRELVQNLIKEVAQKRQEREELVKSGQKGTTSNADVEGGKAKLDQEIESLEAKLAKTEALLSNL